MRPASGSARSGSPGPEAGTLTEGNRSAGAEDLPDGDDPAVDPGVDGDPAHGDPTHSDPARSDPAHSDPAHDDPAREGDEAEAAPADRLPSASVPASAPGDRERAEPDAGLTGSGVPAVG